MQFKLDKLYFNFVDSGRASGIELLTNNAFEDWSGGVTSAPSNWTLAGTGATIAREAIIVKSNTYSASFTRVGTNCNMYQDVSLASGTSYWQGKTVTFSAWVYASQANSVFLQLADGVSTPVSSSYHSGTPGWQYLSVTMTMNTSLVVGVYCLFWIITTNSTAYIDGAGAIETSFVIRANTENRFNQESFVVENMEVEDSLAAQRYIYREIRDEVITYIDDFIESYSDYVNLILLVPDKFRSSLVLQQLLYEFGVEAGTWLGKILDLQGMLDSHSVGDDYIQKLADLVGLTIIVGDTTTLLEKRRQLVEVINWYKMKGTYKALRYIAYLLNLNLSFWDMYTNDYVNFVQQPWFVGNSETDNPGGLTSDYYKSPHLGIDVLLNQVYGTSPSTYLFIESMHTNLSRYVEVTRPVNVVVHYAALLSASTYEDGVVVISAGNIKACVTGNWDLERIYFGDTDTSLGHDANNGLYFNWYSTSFFNGITKWKLGIGNKGEVPTSGDTALESVVLSGTVDSVTDYSDRVDIKFVLPLATVQAGISEMALFLNNGTTMVAEAFFPDVDKINGVELKITFSIYK